MSTRGAPEGAVTRRLARNSLFSVIQVVGVNVLAAVTSFVLARMLGSEGYGRYAYLVWLVSIVVTLATLGIPNTVTRFVSDLLGAGRPRAARLIWRRFLRIELVLAAAGTAALLFYGGASRDHTMAPLLMIAALQVLPMTLHRVQTAVNLGLQQYRWVMTVSLSIAPLQFVLPVGALLLGWGLGGVLAAQAFCFASSALLLDAGMRRSPLVADSSVREPEEAAGGRRVGRFLWMVSAITVLDAIVWQKSEVFFLELWTTESQIAFYSVAFSLTYMLVQIPTVASNVLFPYFSESHGRSDTEALHKGVFQAIKLLALLTIPLGVLGVVFGRYIVLAFYGPEYVSAIASFHVLLIAGVTATVHRPVSTVFYSTDRQGFVLAMGLGLAVVNIGLDLLIIPTYAAIGAAFANSVTQILGTAIGVWYVTTRLGYRYPGAVLRRLLYACVGAGLPAWGVARLLDGLPLAGAAAASVVFLGIYLLLLKATGTIGEEDLGYLRKMLEGAPAWARAVGIRLGRFFEEDFTP